MRACESDPELELLKLLVDGRAHSGQVLAERLGISRAAVSKRADKLEALGVHVNRSRANGYRLESPMELLDSGRIEAALSHTERGRISSLAVLTSVPSTNDLATTLLQNSEITHGAVLLAEYQSRGKGRRGRVWVSPFGRNLCLSVVWSFSNGLAGLQGLSLVVGLGVLRALQAEVSLKAGLKWPNDIVASGAKLGGILIEIEGDVEGPVTAVIGIGLNVSMARAADLAISQAWTDVAALCGEAPSRNRLAGRIIGECIGILAEFDAHPFQHFLDEWRSADALIGKTVSVDSAQGTVRGIARGIDASGALLLIANRQWMRITAGDVSVRSTG